MIEKISGPSPSRSDDRKTSIPDSRYFKELCVEKPGEVEFEEQRKRNLFKEEEEEKKEETPSPYQTFEEKKPSEDLEEVPQSKKFDEEIDLKTPSKKKADAKPLEKKQKKGTFLEGKKESLFETVAKKPLVFTDDVNSKLEKTPLKTKNSLLEPSTWKKKAQNLEEKPISMETLPFSPSIDIQANAALSKVEPFLTSSNILPTLFHDIVGTILVIREALVTRTEVILNGENYLLSPLYESRIVIEKYRSAPDAYNVRLIGSSPAVNLFNEHLSELERAFQNSRFDFTVNLLKVEYEKPRPLIRRKKLDEEKEQEGES